MHLPRTSNLFFSRRKLATLWVVSFGLLALLLHSTRPSGRSLLIIWVVYLAVYINIYLILMFAVSFFIKAPGSRKLLLTMASLAMVPILLLILSSLGQVSFANILYLGLFTGLFVFYISKLG